MAVLLQMKRSEAIQFLGDQQMLSSYANLQLSLLENCLVLLHVDNELPELHVIIKTVPSNSNPGAQLRGHRRMAPCPCYTPTGSNVAYPRLQQGSQEPFCRDTEADQCILLIDSCVRIGNCTQQLQMLKNLPQTHSCRRAAP